MGPLVMPGFSAARGRGLAALALALAVLFAPVLALAAMTYPALTGRVVDDANLLTPEARTALTTKLADLEDKSSIQLVVATVPSLQDADIETFANGLFRAWKLGEAKKNNGLLLLVAPRERKVRIEVGYGLEGVMTDALSSVIIQTTIIPRFKANDYAGGVERGVDAIIGALSTDQAEWQAKARVRTDAQSAPEEDVLPLIVFVLFVFIVFMMIRNARGGRGTWTRRGGQTVFIPGGGWGGGSGGSWGGGSWGGGFGGGGGGFSGGGGSSGGGGASGGW